MYYAPPVHGPLPQCQSYSWPPPSNFSYQIWLKFHKGANTHAKWLQHPPLDCLSYGTPSYHASMWPPLHYKLRRLWPPELDLDSFHIGSLKSYFQGLRPNSHYRGDREWGILYGGSKQALWCWSPCAVQLGFLCTFYQNLCIWKVGNLRLRFQSSSKYQLSSFSGLDSSLKDWWETQALLEAKKTWSSHQLNLHNLLHSF